MTARRAGKAAARKREPVLDPAQALAFPMEAERMQIANTFARQYLDYTGLSAAAAVDALLWSLGDREPIITPETVAEEDLIRHEQLTEQLLEYSSHAIGLLSRAAHDPLWTSTLPETARVAIEERYTLWLEGEHADVNPIEFLTDLPETAPLRAEVDAIAARAMARQLELRDDRLAALLDTPRGRMPDAFTWLATAGGATVLGDRATSGMIFALGAIARAEAEASANEERAAREAVEQQLADQKKRGTLGDRIIFPGALIESGYHPGGGFQKKLEQLDQHEIFADPTVENFLRESAEVVGASTQLARLSPVQVRGLAAVYRLFSTEGDDGSQFSQSRVVVDARTLYQAGGIDPHNGRACRDFFRALDVMSARQLRVALKFRTPDGSSAVHGARSPMFVAQPIWSAIPDGRRQRSEAEADAIAAEWTSRPDSGDESWEGPLPDAYDIELPLMMRRVWSNLALNADILQRMDSGAKAARGKTESFSALDWRLFIEITQRIQRNQPSEDGRTFKSFVDRDALLADYYGVDEVTKARARGKYHGRYVAQYETAVVTLKQGGIAERVEQGRGARRGRVLDVFTIDPDVIMGLEARAERVGGRRAAVQAIGGDAKSSKGSRTKKRPGKRTTP